MKRLRLLCFMLVLASCQKAADRINATTSEGVFEECRRLEGTIPPNDAALFRHAYGAVAGSVAIEANGDSDIAKQLMVRRFNGKTIKDVLADYDGLDPRVKTLAGAGAHEARRQVDELKAKNLDAEDELFASEKWGEIFNETTKFKGKKGPDADDAGYAMLRLFDIQSEHSKRFQEAGEGRRFRGMVEHRTLKTLADEQRAIMKK